MHDSGWELGNRPGVQVTEVRPRIARAGGGLLGVPQEWHSPDVDRKDREHESGQLRRGEVVGETE